MRMLSGLVLVASIAMATAAAAAIGHDRSQQGCVVIGWTTASWTRPVFKCENEDQE